MIGCDAFNDRQKRKEKKAKEKKRNTNKIQPNHQISIFWFHQNPVCLKIKSIPFKWN